MRIQLNVSIGLIGLDTSHVEIFTKLLHEHPHEYSNAKVTIGTPYPSFDLEISRDRVEGYTTTLKNKYNVTIADSIKKVAEKSDAMMITSVDGRKHLEIFKQVVHYQKPIFIDKPLAMSVWEAEEIFSLSEEYRTPIMSSSSLRYADSLVKLLQAKEERPTGVYLKGPLPFIRQMPYYFWYGVHMIEMLLTIMGTSFKSISIQANEQFDVITTEFLDGRFGTIYGDRHWHGKFEAFIHFGNETIHLPIYRDEKPYYAGLLDNVIPFFISGKSPISKEEMLSVLRFVEEASEKRDKISR